MRPAFTRWNHIPMGVQCNCFASVAITPAHDQVGDGLQAHGAHFFFWNHVLFSVQSHRSQQLGCALGMRRVVAGRGVGGNANEFL